MYIYIYIYITHVCVYIYIYAYRARCNERGRDMFSSALFECFPSSSGADGPDRKIFVFIN